MNLDHLQHDIGIYVGHGASHSWTWFADIFDKCGFSRLHFIDEADVEGNALINCNIIFISGGDTFAIAEGLGAKGAAEIDKFVKNGGAYIGSCAGAYLPLHASIPPLNLFNFVQAPISNLTRSLPVPKMKPEKFCTEYGCQYVFHPVREEIRLALHTTANDRTVTAPLYGGPGILPSDDVEILALYDGFTEKTEFLIDEHTAHKTLIGTAAAVKKNYGHGAFYLFGPHLEHPDFFDANQILFDIISNWPSKPQPEPLNERPAAPCRKQDYKRFLSAVSNARIVALSLERSAYRWLIGRKVYDPEKIRVFIETIWQRSRMLDSPVGYSWISATDMKSLICHMETVTRILRQLKISSEGTEDTVEKAAGMFLILRKATATFLDIYFHYKRNSISDEQRRRQCTQTNSILKQQHCFTPSL